MSIEEKYLELLDEVASLSTDSGAKKNTIRIVAVSKRHPISSIQEGIDAGIVDFGENRTRELRDKARQIPGTVQGGMIRWHMIGHLQTNKVKEIIDYVDVVHSLDRLSLANELQKRATVSDRKVDCLVQINISGEDQKYGLDPSQLSEFLEDIHGLDRINVVGLMGMASFSADNELIRTQFGSLRKMRDDEAPDLPHLSMGMSNDYRIAVEEGATLLRIGTSIFGERPGYD